MHFLDSPPCLPLPETKNHSGAQSEAALAIVDGIRKLRVQIFRLRQSHAESVIYFPVHAAARREIKIVARSKRRKSRSKRTCIKRPVRMSAAN